MKILHLLQSNRFSGAENVVCQIIGMMKNESDIEMVYCSSDGQIREAMRERQIQFIPLNRFSIGEIKQVLKKEKPDIIHAHDMRASFYAALACGNIPLVSHIHNNSFDSRGVSAKSIAYIFAAIKARHIFWVSQSSFDGYALHKFFKKKSSVLYNIVDVDALIKKMNLDDNEYDYDVVYIGRLTYQKNPQRLIKIFRLVKERMPNIKFAVVGTGDMEDETKLLVSEYNLNKNVYFLGFQSNPLKIMYDSKVMIMCSRWEGTPMCALEAMSLGVPIVSTPTDGLCELVQQGETGFLENDNDVFADRITEIISNVDMRERLSKNSLRRFSEINDIENYKDVLNECYRKK